MVASRAKAIAVSSRSNAKSSDSDKVLSMLRKVIENQSQILQTMQGNFNDSTSKQEDLSKVVDQLAAGVNTLSNDVYELPGRHKRPRSSSVGASSKTKRAKEPVAKLHVFKAAAIVISDEDLLSKCFHEENHHHFEGLKATLDQGRRNAMKRFLTSAPAFVEENFTDAYAVIEEKTNAYIQEAVLSAQEFRDTICLHIVNQLFYSGSLDLDQSKLTIRRVIIDPSFYEYVFNEWEKVSSTLYPGEWHAAADSVREDDEEANDLLDQGANDLVGEEANDLVDQEASELVKPCETIEELEAEFSEWLSKRAGASVQSTAADQVVAPTRDFVLCCVHAIAIATFAQLKNMPLHKSWESALKNGFWRGAGHAGSTKNLSFKVQSWALWTDLVANYYSSFLAPVAPVFASNQSLLKATSLTSTILSPKFIGKPGNTSAVDEQASSTNGKSAPGCTIGPTITVEDSDDD